MLTVLLSVIQGMIRKKSKMINLTKYARVIIPEEAGGFSCSIMEFPGCYSQGETPKEAWDNLNEAAENWIVACRSQGTPIPEPFPDGLALSIGQEYRKLTKGEDTTRITLPKKEGRPPYHCKPVEELITEDDVIKAIAYDENSQNPKEVNIPILPGPPPDFVTAVVGKHDIKVKKDGPKCDVEGCGGFACHIHASNDGCFELCQRCQQKLDNGEDLDGKLIKRECTLEVKRSSEYNE